MRYVSTRGGAEAGFRDVLLDGLAADGGLYVPQHWPRFTPKTLRSWSSLSWPELLFEVTRPFVAGAVDDSTYRRLIQNACAPFATPSSIPLRTLKAGKGGRKLRLLELFHGPTLAFKDYALQVLGRLFAHELERQDRELTFLAATSGDTGAAAICALRESRRSRLVVLHPHGRVSDIQRRQMTTIREPHILNIAVEGAFDDCQRIVKELLAEGSFSAVNSINWARIMVQSAYYIYAALRLGWPQGGLTFVVPTGNFGNIYAGYVARLMGAPIRRLVAACNVNDALPRFFATGRLAAAATRPTLSPSMDIQLPSNLERFLFESLKRDGTAVAAMMEASAAGGELLLPPGVSADEDGLFAACTVDDEATLERMRRVFHDDGLSVDPHTAVGLEVAHGLMDADGVVCLATAHAAKFPDAVRTATGGTPPPPPPLRVAMAAEEHYDILPAETQAVKAHILSRLAAGRGVVPHIPREAVA